MNAKKAALALFIASLMAALLDCVRGGILLETGLGYLIWNLFLAWIPYLITACCIKKEMPLSRFIPLFILWILFFPNAPYMVTDVIHVASAAHRVWLDGLVFFFFGWIALMLGILSLRDMHGYLQSHMSRAASEIAVFAICAVASFGIYLGRFERWNSWDVIARPRELFNHSVAISSSLGHSGTPLLFMSVFTVFLYTVYKVTAVILADQTITG